MNRRLVFLPFAALVALSGYVGWQMGQPVTETAVLDFHAADWVATGPEGASVTDCFGVPGAHADVWITVTCQRGDDVRRTVIGADGRSLSIPEEPQA